MSGRPSSLHTSTHHRADILRRAGIDDVAGLQLERFRQFCDLLGDTPDHLAEIGVLPDGAVDCQRDRTLLEMAGLACRVNRTEHGRMIKALADLPGLLLRGHAVLKIAPGHVEPERIAIDMVERLLDRNVGAAGFQRRNQLDLVMIVLGQRRIGMIGDLADRDVLNRVGRLLEEERRLAVRIRAALDRVRRIIAADAVDAAHLEHLGLADNRDRHHRHRKDRLGSALRGGRCDLGHRNGGSRRSGYEQITSRG